MIDGTGPIPSYYFDWAGPPTVAHFPDAEKAAG
jgi:hypothetical protein